MRNTKLTVLLMVPLLAAVTYAADSFSWNSGSGYGYGDSGDEFWGGGSYLGVDTRDVTPDRLSALNLKEEHGVEVTMVDQDAPAGKAGIKEHDVIMSVNGSQVESVEQLRRMIHEIPPGRVVTLGVSRNGQPLTMKIQLADRKQAMNFGPGAKEFKFAMPAIPPVPPIPDMDIPVSIVVVHSSVRSGLMVENLTQQLGDFFGAKDGQGVLVRSVEKGSRAEKAGFRAGDVIVRVNGESVGDTGDFTHALRSGKDNNAASVSIIRDRKEQTLTLTLPERRQSGSVYDEESFDVPEINAETRNELSKLQCEMAKLKPEMEQVLQRRQMAEMERQTRSAARQAEMQAQDMQRNFHDHQLEIQKELKHMLKGGADI